MAAFMVSPYFAGHPAVYRAGTKAVGLWVLAGSWCAGNSPDGFVPVEYVKTQPGGLRLAQRLVDAGLWDAEDDGWWFSVDSVRELWWIDREQHRRKIPKHVRQMVLERDCHACLRCGSTGDLTMDHVLPWSRGGSDLPTNLQTLCMPCNRAKGASV